MQFLRCVQGLSPENGTEFRKDSHFLLFAFAAYPYAMKAAFSFRTSASAPSFRSASRLPFRLSLPLPPDRPRIGWASLPRSLLRKEVIQPHLPIRLPCYDFTPVIDLTFDSCPLRQHTGFGCSQLPWCDGRCVQGPGTYSPRHSDPRLLATPTSCGRVAAHNPNWDGFFEIRSGLRLRSSL